MKFLKVTPAVANAIYLSCKERCVDKGCTHKLALFWKRTGSNGAADTHVSLTTMNGYKFYRYNRSFVSVHKVVWYLTHGKFKAGCHIDHIDGNRTNFQPDNLREITISESMLNRKRPDRGGELLPKGVQTTASGKFKSSISIKGKTVHLGTFESAAIAHEVWRVAAKKLHGEFFCDRV